MVVTLALVAGVGCTGLPPAASSVAGSVGSLGGTSTASLPAVKPRPQPDPVVVPEITKVPIPRPRPVRKPNESIVTGDTNGDGVAEVFPTQIRYNESEGYCEQFVADGDLLRLEKIDCPAGYGPP